MTDMSTMMTPTTSFAAADQRPLALDVLIRVSELADDQLVVLALSSTCKTMRRYGAPLTLEHENVVRDKAKALSFFHLFHSCAKNAFRIPIITTVRIALPVLRSARDVATMAAGLRALSNLNVLTLENSDACLWAHAEVLEAIASLRTVTHLVVVRARASVSRLLQRMSSPLEDIELQDAQSHTLGLNILARYTASLQRLFVSPGHQAGLRPDQWIGDGLDLDRLPVFQRCTTLCLPGYGPGDVGNSFIKMFPNLRQLDIGVVRTVWNQTAVDIRVWNVAETRAFWARVRPHNEEEGPDSDQEDAFDFGPYFNDENDAAIRRCWRNLKLVKGGLVDLAALGNTSTTVEMEIAGDILSHFLLIPCVVGDNAPRVLRLSIRMPFTMAGISIEDATAHMTSVRKLTIRALVGRAWKKDTARNIALLVNLFQNVEFVFVEIIADKVLLGDLHAIGERIFSGGTVRRKVLQLEGPAPTQFVSLMCGSTFYCRRRMPGSTAIRLVEAEEAKAILKVNGMLSDEFTV
ncbi:hypothetical protein C8Q74DRAFT_1288158 [Fomes fomentarius]|nr:hypothetical protein C8Q74DRAFT_1288158 [Fomes fomentarius]